MPSFNYGDISKRLTMRDTLVASALYQHGKVTVPQLEQLLGMPSSTIRDSLDRMRKNNLVSKHPENGRLPIEQKYIEYSLQALGVDCFLYMESMAEKTINPNLGNNYAECA